MNANASLSPALFRMMQASFWPDEPTASLNREAADALIADLVAKVLKEGKTLIAVSHDEHLLEAMNRVITLTDGQIEAPARAHPS